MLLTLVYMLLMAFMGLQFSAILVGATAFLDVLGLLIVAGMLGIGEDGSNNDLTDYP